MRPLTRACVLVLLVVFLSGASSRDTQSEFDALQPNSNDSGTIKRVEFPEPALIETRADLAARAKSLTVLSLTVTAVSVGCEIINFGIQVVKKLIVRHQIKSAMKEVVIAQSKLNESLLAHEAFVASLEAIEDRQLQAAKELVAYARKEKLFTGKEKQDDPFAAMFMSFYLTTGSSDVLRQKLRAIVESSTSLHGINFPKFREDVEELAKSLGDEVFNTFKEFADPSDKSAPPELLMPILKSHPALMAAYPFISPTISIAISGIKVLINLADLYATTKSCGEIVDWISSEKDVYVQDVDWNFCRLYGSLFDSVHDIDVSFDKMWREVPEAKKTDRLRALFMAFAEPLTQMKAAVMQKFAPCERFVNTQPLGSPITEMWTTRLAGAGEQAKNVSARPISVVNQPSVVKTQNVQKITNLYVYQAESTPDKFFVPGLSPEPKDLNWFGGDRIWSPIDSVAQKYEAKTARRLRPDGVAYDFDLTCKGPLGVSSMQPVLYTRRWNRRRDATTTQIQFCDTFGRAQRTAVQHSRCEQVNRASDAFKGFMEHEYHAKDNPEFTVFAPGKRFRFEFLLGLMNKPGPEPPNLFFEYERTGYRAPIVDIRDKGDAAGHNFQDGTWFPVPSIIDEYSDGCAQLRFHAFYRKDFSLPAPKGFIPSGKPKSSSADSSSSSSSSSGSKKQRN